MDTMEIHVWKPADDGKWLARARGVPGRSDDNAVAHEGETMQEVIASARADVVEHLTAEVKRCNVLVKYGAL